MGTNNAGHGVFAVFNTIANVAAIPAFLIAVAGGVLRSFDVLLAGVIAVGVVTVAKAIGFVPVWLARARSQT